MQPEFEIAKLKDGDEASFRQLAEHYKNRVYNTCLGFVKNREDAEDLAQEVFVEVFESIRHFREQAMITSWIYRIAVNKSLEFLRKKKSKKRWAFIQSIFGGEEGEQSIERADESFHPGIAVENRERASILFQAIDKLPENQRVAFTLHKVEDLSYQEVSKVMETSIATVESLMFRAKKNLQKQLHEYYEKHEKN